MFEIKEVDIRNITLHTGGAEGSDQYFEKLATERNILVKAYSHKTKYHNSPNKVEISEEDYLEGVSRVNTANKTLNRWGISRYMNLLARNWAQVKYSSQIIAIGEIVNSGQKTPKGYCRSKYQSVNGGTGYAVQMGVDNRKEVFVFDQVKKEWFRWSYVSLNFVKCDCPKISYKDFAGIGTRELNEFGKGAIDEVFKLTFDQANSI